MIQIPKQPFINILEKKDKQGKRYVHVYQSHQVDEIREILEKSIPTQQEVEWRMKRLRKKTFTWFKDPDPDSGKGIVMIVRVGKIYLMFYESYRNDVYYK